MEKMAARKRHNAESHQLTVFVLRVFPSARLRCAVFLRCLQKEIHGKERERERESEREQENPWKTSSTCGFFTAFTLLCITVERRRVRQSGNKKKSTEEREREQERESDSPWSALLVLLRLSSTWANKENGTDASRVWIARDRVRRMVSYFVTVVVVPRLFGARFRACARVCLRTWPALNLRFFRGLDGMVYSARGKPHNSIPLEMITVKRRREREIREERGEEEEKKSVGEGERERGRGRGKMSVFFLVLCQIATLLYLKTHAEETEIHTQREAIDTGGDEKGL
jgi:hypothetical protein